MNAVSLIARMTSLKLISVHIALPCVMIGSLLAPSQQSSSIHLRVQAYISFHDFYYITVDKFSLKPVYYYSFTKIYALYLACNVYIVYTLYCV